MSRQLLFALVAHVLVPAAAQAAEDPANGVFLVASRALQDRNFRETVVLVTHPRRGAPWGVIINRPLDTRLEEVFDDQPSLKGRPERLFRGGPVMAGGLVFLVRGAVPPAGAGRALPNVFFTADVPYIERLLRRPEPTRGLRVFAGYAGWTRGQLQAEIARGDWHVMPADEKTIFEKDPQRVWPELVGRARARRAPSSKIVKRGGRCRQIGFDGRLPIQPPSGRAARGAD